MAEISEALLQTVRTAPSTLAQSQGQKNTIKEMQRIQNVIATLKKLSSQLGPEQRVNECIQVADEILISARNVEYDIRFFFGYHSSVLPLFQEGERFMALIARAKLGPLSE